MVCVCVCVFVVSTQDYFLPGPISKNVRKKLVEGRNKEEEEVGVVLSKKRR